MLKLSEAAAGNDYVITWFITSSQALSSIKEAYKLREEAKIRVLQNTHGNIILRINEKKLALTSDIAERIRVTASL